MEETEEKLQFLRETGTSEERTRNFLKQYTAFSRLTSELVQTFIHFIEVGEKNKDKEQEVVVHWKF